MTYGDVRFSQSWILQPPAHQLRRQRPGCLFGGAVVRSGLAERGAMQLERLLCLAVRGLPFAAFSKYLRVGLMRFRSDAWGLAAKGLDRALHRPSGLGKGHLPRGCNAREGQECLAPGPRR